MSPPEPRVPVVRRLGDGAAAVLTVFDEIDSDSRPALAAAVDQALTFVCGTDHTSGLLVVDLREVRFLNSAGLNELLRLYRQYTAGGGREQVRLVVAPEQGFLHRLLAVSRLDSAFSVYSDVSTALGPQP